MKYDVNEIFYSLQGEGLYTGTPMVFIRLAGCNLGCAFCDTNFETVYEYGAKQIADEVRGHNDCRRVCITGGEPLLQDLTELLIELHSYFVHVETNGACELKLPFPNWITVSPKNDYVNTFTLQRANEVKFLYGKPYRYWEDIICELKPYINETVTCYLQPIDGPDLEENTQRAVQYCLMNPRFRLSLQTHKLLKIK